jgi:hypothetical protein
MNGTVPYLVAHGNDIVRANWSADGKRVFYIRSSAKTIESVSAEGGAPFEVFRAQKDQSIVDVVELSDGSLLIAMSPSGCCADLWFTRCGSYNRTRRVLFQKLRVASLGLAQSWCSNADCFVEWPRNGLQLNC